MSRKNRRKRRSGPTFFQNFWRHYTLVPDGTPYRQEVYHREGGYNMYDGTEVVQDQKRGIEHYGRKESCARCRREGRNLAEFENELTRFGVAIILLTGLATLAGLLIWLANSTSSFIK